MEPVDNLAQEGLGEFSLIESFAATEPNDSLVIGIPNEEGELEQTETDEVVEAPMTEAEIEAKTKADAIYMKKLAANNAVKNLAAMFGKKAAPVEANFKARAKVDMSKFAKPAKADYGLKLDKLRDWKAERTRELEQREESLQEMAVAKVRGFMDAVLIIVKLQSWIRMIKPRRKYYLYRLERIVIRRKFFYGWKRYVKGQLMRLHYVIGKPFRAWKEEVEDVKRLQSMVLQFFQTSIKKLRLTPQSIMCFFSAEKFNSAISETDINKIRRLILSAIFRGWRIQVRSLKTMQFRAAQIISRMVRRTKGVLYSKEAVLVCYHLWKRYVAVRIAYRREELDPFFAQPLIPQWNTLYQLIVVQRIRKKRAAELGQRLIALRTWKRWRNMMTMDKSQMLNPQQRADIHYSSYLSRCVLTGWFEVIRERGRNVRRRNKIFYMWANWAPNKRRMRSSYLKALSLAQFARIRTAYNVIKSQCYEVIGKRAIALKLVRQNICNRKLMVCAYALANHDDHVMFLDCWRRWQKYWRARWRWKSIQWQYQIQWYQQKLRAIMDAWKKFTQDSKHEKEEALRYNGLNFIMDDDDQEHVEVVDKIEPTLLHGITYNTLGLFERSLKNICESVPDEEAFLLICRATTKSSNIIQKRRKFILDALANDNSVILQDDVGEESKSSSLKKLKAAKDVAAGIEPVHDFEDEAEDNNVNSGLDDVITGPITAHESALVNAYKERQDKLQRAIDYFNLNAAATVIEEGAEVQQSHIRQLMARTGDEHLPFLGMLLSSSRDYICERIRKHDRKKEVFYCHSPLAAMLVNSHLQRWENRSVSSREISQLTKGRELTDYIGGRYQSNILWRLVLLMLIKKRADDIQNTCMVLHETRSVDQEVAEVLKRQKIARLRANRDSIRKLFGIAIDPSGGRGGVPQLMRESVVKRRQAPQNFNSYVKSLDIFVLLKEFTLLTGKLTGEAVALRAPMMQRDSTLLANGLRKQYHADFQALKLDCMSEAETRQYHNAKLKLEKQEALANKKRLAKEAKKLTQGSQKPTLGMLLAHRDGGEVVLTPKDHGAELIFSHRSLNYRNMILETWQPDAWRHKSESAKATLVLRRRKESIFIYNRIIAFFSELFPPMTTSAENNSDYVNPNLPDPRFLPSSGYSGYILMSVLKHLFPKEVATGDTSGMLFASDEVAHRYMRGLKKWVPTDWWAFKRVKQMLTREAGIISRVVKEADIRAKTIHLANLKVGKQKTSHLSFLKSARNELLSITEKAGSILTQDRKAYELKLVTVHSCEKEVLMLQAKIAKNQAHVVALDRFISMGRVREMMEYLEIRVPEIMDEEAENALRYKAYGIVEEAKRDGMNMRCRVMEVENRKVELLADLKATNKNAAKGRRVMNEFASDRMKVIADVQMLVTNAIKTQKNNDVEKSVEQQAKKIVQCYEDTIETLSDVLFGGDAPKKPSKESHHKPQTPASPSASLSPGGKKTVKEDDDDNDEDDEKDGEEEEAVGEDEEALLQQSLQATDLVAAMEDQDEELSVSVETMVDGSSSEEEDDDEWNLNPKKTFGDRKSAVLAVDDDASSVDSCDSEETMETIDSAKLKGIDSGAIGFGSTTYQEELQEEKLAGVQRKSSLTPGEIEALEKERQEEAKRQSEANAATELKMRIFDEYWFSLGEDIKGKREQKKKANKDSADNSTLASGMSSPDSSVKGYGRTGKMFKRARSKKRRLKYKSVFDEDYVRPTEHAVVDDESVTHQQQFLKNMELTVNTVTRERDATLAAMWRNDVPGSMPNPKLFPNNNLNSRGNTANSSGIGASYQFGGFMSAGGLPVSAAPQFKLSVAIGMQCEDEATIILGLNKEEGPKKPLFGPMSRVGYVVKPTLKEKIVAPVVHDDHKAKSILDRKKKRKARNAAKVATEGGVANTAAHDAVSMVSKDDAYIQAGSVLAPVFKANRAHYLQRIDMLMDIHMDQVNSTVNKGRSDISISRGHQTRSPGIGNDAGSSLATEDSESKDGESAPKYISPYRTPAMSRQVSNVGLFYKVAEDGSMIATESAAQKGEDDASLMSSVSGGIRNGDDFDSISKDGTVDSASTMEVFPSLTEQESGEISPLPVDGEFDGDGDGDAAAVITTPRSSGALEGIAEMNAMTPVQLAAPPLESAGPVDSVGGEIPVLVSPLGSPDADISLGGISNLSGFGAKAVEPPELDEKVDDDEPDVVPFSISHVRIMQTTPLAGASRPTAENGYVSSSASIGSASVGRSATGSPDGSRTSRSSKPKLERLNIDDQMVFDDELDDDKSKSPSVALSAEDMKTIASTTTGTVQGVAVGRLAGSHGGLAGVSVMNRAPTHSVEEVAPKPVVEEKEEEEDFVIPAVSAAIKSMKMSTGTLTSIKKTDKLKHHTHSEADSAAAGLVAVPHRSGSWMLRPKDSMASPSPKELLATLSDDENISTTTSLEEAFNEAGRSLQNKSVPRRSGSIASQKSPLGDGARGFSRAPSRNPSVSVGVPQRNSSVSVRAPQRNESVPSNGNGNSNGAPQRNSSIVPQRNRSQALNSPKRNDSISVGVQKRRSSVAQRNPSVMSNSQVVGKSDYEEDEDSLKKQPVLARGQSIQIGRRASVSANAIMVKAMSSAARASSDMDADDTNPLSMEDAMMEAMMLINEGDDEFDDDYYQEEEAKKQALVDALGIREEAESEDTKIHYAEAVANIEPLRDTASHLLKWRSYHHGHINHGHLEQDKEEQPLVSLTSLVEKTLEETVSKSEQFDNKLDHITDDDGEEGGYLAALMRADAILQEEAAQKALQAKMAAARLGFAKKEKKIFGFKHTELNSISEVKPADLTLGKDLESIGKARELFESEEDATDVDRANSPKNAKKLFTHLLVSTDSFQADLNRSHLEKCVLIMKARVHASLTEETLRPHRTMTAAEMNQALHKNAMLRSNRFARGFKKSKSHIFAPEGVKASIMDSKSDSPSNTNVDASAKANKLTAVDDSDNESDNGSVMSTSSAGTLRSIDSNQTHAPSLQPDSALPKLSVDTGFDTSRTKLTKKTAVDDDSESSAFPMRLKTVQTKKKILRKRLRSPNESDQATVVIRDKDHASYVSLKEVGQSGSIFMSITDDKEYKVPTPRGITASTATLRENQERSVAVGSLSGTGVKAMDRSSPANAGPEGELDSIVRLQKPVKKFNLCPVAKKEVHVSIEADLDKNTNGTGDFWDQDLAALQYHTLDINNYKLGVVNDHGVKRIEKFYYDYEDGEYVRLPPPRTASPERLSDLVPPQNVGVFEGMIPPVPSTLLRLDGRDKVHVVSSPSPHISSALVERAVQETRNLQNLPLDVSRMVEQTTATAGEHNDFDYEDDAVAMAYQTILDYHDTLSVNRQQEMLEIFIRQQEYEQQQDLMQQLMQMETLKAQEMYSPTRGNKCQEETNAPMLRSRSASPDRTRRLEGSSDLKGTKNGSRFGTGTIDGIASQFQLDAPGISPEVCRMSPGDGPISPQETETSVFANLLDDGQRRPLTDADPMEPSVLPVRLKSRQEDRVDRKSRVSAERKAILSRRTSARTGSPGLLESEEDDASVLTKGSVDLGNNKQFSVSVEVRPGVASPGADEEQVDPPMDGINRPYSRQVMSAVTPSGRTSLQDYFKDPEFSLSESFRASRAGRQEQEKCLENDNGCVNSSDVSLSDKPPSVQTPSLRDFQVSPEKIRVKIVEGDVTDLNLAVGMADDVTELSYHTTLSNNVSLPSIFPARGFSAGSAGASAGNSRPVSSETSYDDDDEEYMEAELRNMLAQTQQHKLGNSSKNLNRTSPTMRVGESLSLPQLPGNDASALPRVHAPKARKIFGSADVVSNKRKLTKQGNLLSFSDSMPLLAPTAGLELRSEKPHMVNRFKLVPKKTKVK